MAALVSALLELLDTLCLESLGVTVIVCWADARVYPLANLQMDRGGGAGTEREGENSEERERRRKRRTERRTHGVTVSRCHTTQSRFTTHSDKRVLTGRYHRDRPLSHATYARTRHGTSTWLAPLAPSHSSSTPS
jgi:hypothetical protein